jgi:anti-anti-sigma factor
MENLSGVVFEQNGDIFVIRFMADEDMIEFADPETGETFISHIAQSTANGIQCIQFDMVGITRINSALLGLIVQVFKEVKPKGIEVRVVNTNPAIQKIMQLTRLTYLLQDNVSA